MGNSKASTSPYTTKWWTSTKWKNIRWKWSRWEYWPFLLIYFPVFIYWTWLSLKARSPIFFVATNPGIQGGGISGESKQAIYDKVPASYLPKTFYLRPKSPEKLQQFIPQLEFPLFVKPDVGKRGRLVKKIYDEESLWNHYRSLAIPVLIQENIKYEQEFSVYYYRFPTATTGEILSLVYKEYPSVVGDGFRTIEQLIDQDRRLTYYAAILKPLLNPETLTSIPGKGKRQLLSTIGNHAQGAIFHDNRHLIDEKLTDTFDQFFSQLDGIYLGRVDLKTPSLSDLKNGIFQVVEINGVGAELAHIYSTGYPLLKAYREIFHSWHLIYEISLQNRSLGVSVVSLKQAYNWLMHYLRYSRDLKKMI